MGLTSSLEFVELLEDLAIVRKARVSKYFQGGVLGLGREQNYKIILIFNEEVQEIFLYIKKRFICTIFTNINMMYI